eukprot:UN00729
MSWNNQNNLCRCSPPRDYGDSHPNENCYRLTPGIAPLKCTDEEKIEIKNYIDGVFTALSDTQCPLKLRDADGNITAEECACFLKTDPNDAPVVARGCLYHKDHPGPLTEIYFDCLERYPVLRTTEAPDPELPEEENEVIETHHSSSSSTTGVKR